MSFVRGSICAALVLLTLLGARVRAESRACNTIFSGALPGVSSDAAKPAVRVDTGDILDKFNRWLERRKIAAAAKRSGFRLAPSSTGMPTEYGYKIESDGSRTSGPSAWFHRRAKTLGIELYVNDQFFRGGNRNWAAVAEGSRIYIRRSTLAELDSAENRASMAHEIVHATNDAICTKTGDCSASINFVSLRSYYILHPTLGYRNFFYADEFNAYSLDANMRTSALSPDEILGFGTEQLRFLQAAKSLLQAGEMPNENGNLRIRIDVVGLVVVNVPTGNKVFANAKERRDDFAAMVDLRIRRVENLLKTGYLDRAINRKKTNVTSMVGLPKK